MNSTAPVSSRRRVRELAASYLRPHETAVSFALAGILAQSLLVIPVPLLQGWALDRLAAAARDGADFARVIVVAFGLSVGCYGLRGVIGWRAAVVMHRVSLEIVRDLTDAMHRKIQRQPLAYLDRHSTGDLLARLTADVGSLLLFLNGGALQLVCDLVLAAGAAAVLGWIEWRLALVAAVVLPLAAVSHRHFAAVARRLARAAADHTASLYAQLSERLSALRVVRAFAREPAELAELDRRLDDHRVANLALARTGGWHAAGAALIGGVGSVLVVAYGVLLVRGGSLTVGELLAFIALLAYLYQPVVRLAAAGGLLAGTLAAADRIVQVLDAPEAETGFPHEAGGESQLSRHAPAIGGRVEFRNVVFAYNPAGPRVLDGISFAVEPGESVGITGPSGAGKSTLLALIGRFYTPTAGTILLDGSDVRSFGLAELRRSVALVPQHTALFQGTIRSNLTYAAPEADEAELWRALEATDLAHFVAGLSQGLETPVGERGVTLSGGQRQRLALARALVADPAVLLLDDCTSALDPATEPRVHAAVAALRPGRTRLIVSHNVAMLAACDRVLVLESGRLDAVPCVV
jgi:ABC-type multidrug transport system fused ATPase/permease subunit